MPPLVQKFTYLIPLGYYIAIARGIFLKGVGWAELRDEAAVLAVYGVVILGLATVFFRKQVRETSLPRRRAEVWAGEPSTEGAD